MIQTKYDSLEQRILYFVEQSPNKIAIKGDKIDDSNIDNDLTYQQLLAEIDSISKVLQLSQSKYQTFAIIMNNHPAWAVLDLALMFKKQCAVPLPAFFSKNQTKHSLLDAGVEHLIIEKDGSTIQQLSNFLEEYFDQGMVITIANKKLLWLKIKAKYAVKHKHGSSTQKITYTSGTTDKPKGVMLSHRTILTKIQALAEASEANNKDVSLSILPLSTLLENIAGLYVPLYCGAQTTLLSPETIGISGSSQVNTKQLMSTLQKFQPSVFIITPQILLLLIKLLQSAYQLPASVRFIAMGGAPVSKHLLILAQQLKIPVFEGYGLSEASSVVAVNTPSIHCLGSVGKVLNCHEIKISDEGEVLLKGELFNGYLNGDKVNPDEFYATGDIGEIDSEGFLFITGRIKNVINTSYGRNISPEWIEKELETIPCVAQGVVYGHGKPYLVALLVLRDLPGLSKDQILEQLNTALENLNSKLPDYARIADFIEIEDAFSLQNHQLTGTGRPRRNNIYNMYKNNLDFYYATVEKVCEPFF